MKLQCEIIDKHFHNDYECIERAFEDFAQGVLYDIDVTLEKESI
jgi:hypothetical protein